MLVLTVGPAPALDLRRLSMRLSTRLSCGVSMPGGASGHMHIHRAQLSHLPTRLAASGRSHYKGEMSQTPSGAAQHPVTRASDQAGQATPGQVSHCSTLFKSASSLRRRGAQPHATYRSLMQSAETARFHVGAGVGAPGVPAAHAATPPCTPTPYHSSSTETVQHTRSCTQ